jgi:hypothetical protein
VVQPTSFVVRCPAMSVQRNLEDNAGAQRDAGVEREDIHFRISRRIFLALAGRGFLAASAIAALGLSQAEIALGASPASDGIDQLSLAPAIFTPRERLLLAAVQEHLLPSEPNSPGSRDIRATAYLEAALSGHDVSPRDAKRIKEGCVALMKLTSMAGSKDFSRLSSTTREKVLRNFEKTDDGETWLYLVLGYTLEAYAGDPSYGGNTDGAVWRWLGHTPGYPRPPVVTMEARR